MYRSLSQRLIIPIAAAIVAGMLAVVVFYSLAQQRNILQQNERSIYKLTDSVIHGLQTIMLAGYADIAELFVERLQGIGGVADLRILRRNGMQAFKDNQTLGDVNRRRGEELFQPRDSETSVQVVPADLPELRQAVSSKRFATYYEEAGGVRTLTFLWPIVNEKPCRKCHGGDHEVRGVLKFTTSLKVVDEEVERTWQAAAAIMSLALVLIVVAMALIVRRWVVAPIKTVSGAMQRVSEGDLSQAVPVFGRDELAAMATSFNIMLQELRETYGGFKTEHNKLETIIRGSRDGIVVTDGEGRVALVNPAAERLLGKTGAELGEGGFETLFDDPERMRSLLDHPQGDGDVIAYNDRFLAVSAAAIRMDDGRLVGRAAMLRDVTEEKRLERMLRALSNTDGLTGLANRRMLDESLAREILRCCDHGHPLSILMFDVDHFKKFNDTYGHDQGDRVLKHVAEAARDAVRTIDLPCRYGGEEFVVILIETRQEGAMIVAERMREAIEAMRVDGLQVTTTIGVAELAATGARSAEELIARADEAMYEGKRAGRNRVVVAGPAKGEGG